MLQKLFLTSVLVLFEQRWQLRAGLIAVGVYMALVLVRRPYVRAMDDTINLLVQAEVGLVLIAGMAIR